MVNGVRNPPLPTEQNLTGYVPPRVKHTINKITLRPDCEVIPEDDIFQYKADFVTLFGLVISMIALDLHFHFVALIKANEAIELWNAILEHFEGHAQNHIEFAKRQLDNWSANSRSWPSDLARLTELIIRYELAQAKDTTESYKFQILRQAVEKNLIVLWFMRTSRVFSQTPVSKQL